MREAGDLLPNLSLPLLTGSYAAYAKTLGAFGLVGLVITNAYQSADLSLNRPGKAFTNHYHRTGGEGGQGTDLSVGEVVWVIIAYNRGEPTEPSEVAERSARCRKENFLKGRSAYK